ncbi:unannotated protein [freshwater metagenome]|uniref:Unannotated protein n=1 Tax=freshwater metagenome TaxID=449393 RepID=A0A6J6EY82_9ZZZZ
MASTIMRAATSAANWGNLLAASELAAGTFIPEFWAMLVAVAPGNTMVTPTLVSSSSERSPSVMSFTAALDAP